MPSSIITKEVPSSWDLGEAAVITIECDNCEKTFTVEPNLTGNVSVPKNGLQGKRGRKGGREYSTDSNNIPPNFDFLRR